VVPRLSGDGSPLIAASTGLFSCVSVASGARVAPSTSTQQLGNVTAADSPRASYARRTLHANIRRFSSYQLLPRMLRDVAQVDISTSLFGHRLAFPVLVAPTAMQCMAHLDGERVTAYDSFADGLHHMNLKLTGLGFSRVQLRRQS
jgi:hypothetical protein